MGALCQAFELGFGLQRQVQFHNFECTPRKNVKANLYSYIFTGLA